MKNPKYVVVTGPEGSGTTYLWKCLATNPNGYKPIMAPRTKLLLDHNYLLPAYTLMHVSLPAKRPPNARQYGSPNLAKSLMLQRR